MSRRYIHERYQHSRDAEFIALYQSGLTLRQVAAKCGVSARPVRDALRRGDIPLRPAGRSRAWEGNPEQRAELVRMYTSGMSVKDIRDQLGCRSEVVVKALRDEGVKARPVGSDIKVFRSEAEVDEVVREYLAGSTSMELAKKHGTTQTTIINYLRERGVERRRGRSPFNNPKWDQQAADLYRQGGWTQDQLAEQFGVTQVTISRHLRMMGLTPKRQPSRRSEHPSWRGGRHIDGQGYVRVKIADSERHLVDGNAADYAAEHRLVMARILGRKLLSESVHHINGDKQDNRPSNLQLRQGAHGVGIALECSSCGSHDVVAVPLAS